MKASELLVNLKNRKPRPLGHRKAMNFAVFLPLVEMNGETHVLFEVRASHMRRQPGEVCFPGGRMDNSDASELHCAVRETMEELGLSQGDISHVIPLDYIVSGYGTIIYPFAGCISSLANISANEEEVGELFTVPLSYFLRNDPARYKIHFDVRPEEGFPFDLIIGGENYNWQVRHMEEYFYQYEGRVIWGLTARILSHFLELVESSNGQGFIDLK